MKMKSLFIFAMFCLISLPLAAQNGSGAQKEISTEWNGAVFSSHKTLSENIAEVPNLGFFAKALENETLKTALENEEKVTVFVVADSGFLKLPEKTRDSIVNNAKIMSALVKFYTVAGRIDSNSMNTAVERNNGTAYFATLNGEKLGLKKENGNLLLFDSENNTAIITDTDFYHKNGFFHIIDGLIFPSKE